MPPVFAFTAKIMQTDSRTKEVLHFLCLRVVCFRFVVSVRHYVAV